MKSKLYSWASRRVHAPFASLWLGLLFFLEIIIFLPLDGILVLYCLERPSRKYLYVLIATLASTCAAVAGYFIGIYLWETWGPFILKHLISSSFFEQLRAHYQQYESWAVFIGAFLPLPFKAVTDSAGVCQLSFVLFMIAVFLGRAFRFLGISKILDRWHEQIRGFLQQSFLKVITAVGVKLILTVVFFWVLGHG